MRLNLLLFLIAFIPIFGFAQTKYQRGERALENGNYAQAVDYFQKAYEETPNPDIHKKVIFASSLKKEFAAFEAALQNNNFTDAETHLDNVLMLDLANQFVEAKRNQIKEKQEI